MVISEIIRNQRPHYSASEFLKFRYNQPILGHIFVGK
jgi:hypothetical protein